MPHPRTFTFADDGLVPNNPLPFLLYAGVVDVSGGEPEAMIEQLFSANGWGQQMWRDGIFDYLHYHATVHEALGIARGHARVQFGGERGAMLDVRAGDVVVLPAGTGHRRFEASKDFSVVGGYPPGADGGDATEESQPCEGAHDDPESRRARQRSGFWQEWRAAPLVEMSALSARCRFPDGLPRTETTSGARSRR